METIETKIPSPETSSDPMSVHLWYVRRDISEIKGTLSDLKNGYVTRTDFDEHLKTDADHESRIRTLEKNMWKWIGASSIISAGAAYVAQFLIK